MSEVSDLLHTSLGLHERAKRARQFREPTARDLLQQAYDTRRAALAADPQMTDPSWVVPGQASHEALMAFYVQQLSR